MQANALLSVVVATIAASSAYGTYVEVKVGRNPSAVYLKSGRVDLAYEFSVHAPTGDEPGEDGGLTIIVSDSTGATLFRNAILGASGWYHTTFFNPGDGYVTFRGTGGFAMAVPHGGSAARVLDPNTSIVRGDPPPAGPPTQPSSPIQPSPTPPSTPPPGLPTITPNSPNAPPSSGPPTTTPNPPSTSPPTVVAPRAPEIHAVIISGHTDPTKILRGNVHLVGGLIALGRQPESPGTWDPGLKITPDPELITGQKVPPVTPNLFDVRIMHFEIFETLKKPAVDH